MITRMEEWDPPHATAFDFERTSLLGPLCRLGVFSPEWVSLHFMDDRLITLKIQLLQPGIAQMYFSEPDKRLRNDIDSSFASLRGTLKSLQVCYLSLMHKVVGR